MRLKEIYEIADKIAPFALSKEYCDTYKAYDNSGVQLDCGEEIDKALFALDLSTAAVERARQEGANLIFTHHPAIYTGLKSLTPYGEGKEILACAKAGISVISSHLCLDCAQGGIDESLMNGLGGTRYFALMQPVSAGGYGRVFEVEERSFSAFAEESERTFGALRTVVYDSGRPVKKVACFCGGGMDEETVNFALENGADTFVSSDGKHHLVKGALDGGMNVLLFTHYASEIYGFYRFYQKIKERAGIPCAFFTDERYL